MKEFIEKLIGRLEELNQSQIEKYTKSLCEGNLNCVYDKTDIEDTKVKTTYEIIQIVNRLAEEYGKDNNVATNGWVPYHKPGRYYDLHGSAIDNVIAWQHLPNPYIPNKE